MRQLAFREAQQVSGGLLEDGVTTYTFNGEGWTVWGESSIAGGAPIWEGTGFNYGGFVGIGDDGGGTAGTIPDSTTGQQVSFGWGLVGIGLAGFGAAVAPVTLLGAILFTGGIYAAAAGRVAGGIPQAIP